MIYGPFSLSDATNAELLFYLSCEVGAADVMAWGASIDGTNFYGLGLSNTGNYPSWESINFDLTSVPTLGNVCGQSSVWIMLWYYADAVQDYNVGAYVDNITLQKESTPPPVAGFSGSPTSGTAPLSVNFTDASTGSITSRSWSFGDGGSSTTTNPTHTYSSAGTYTVELTVTGPGGSDKETRTNYITVTTVTPIHDVSLDNFWFFPEPPLPVGEKVYEYLHVQVTNQGNCTEVISSVNCTWQGPLVRSREPRLLLPVPPTSFEPGETKEVYAAPDIPGIAGTYNFTVTVPAISGEDDTGDNTRTEEVQVGDEDLPTANFSGSPTSGTAPLSVNFTDASSGSIASWHWDFGDGDTNVVQHPAHTYDSTGTFTVSLTVSGPGGSDTEEKTAYITVLPSGPVAAFGADTTSGTAPLAVQFADSSTGDIDAWHWDFGDGDTSVVQHPAHTYDTTGTFTVSMTVTGPGGSDTEEKTDYITVLPSAPVAAFGADTTSGTAPLAVQFADSSTGDIDTWHWDFGDGDTSSVQHPAHTYDTTGTFTVSLTVTGPGGSDTELSLIHI